jgi:hypothetical protein
MAVSTTDKELLKYFTLLNEPQKKSLLELIKTFFKGETNQQNTPTLEEYNKELDEAMGRISKGEFTTIEELEKEMETW